MQITFPLSVFISAALAVMSGLGIGGGSILMLWLTIVCHLDVVTARLINLMFFIPTAAIASLFRFQKSDIPLKPLIPAMISGCLFAVFFSALMKTVSVSFLEKAFGAVLIATGLREITYRARNAR